MGSWVPIEHRSNTVSPGPRPTSVPSRTLIHSTVWPQNTNVADRQDRQDIGHRYNRSRSVGRTVTCNGSPKTVKKWPVYSHQTTVCVFVERQRTSLTTMSTTTTTTLRSTTPVSGNSDETGRLSASISSNTSNELSNAPTTRTSTLAKILPDAPASLRPEYRLETQRRLFPDKFHSVGLISSRGRRRHRKTSNTCVYRPTDETGLHMSHRNVKNLKHVWQILTLRETGIMPPLPSIHAPSHLHCTVSAELQRRSVEGLC